MAGVATVKTGLVVTGLGNTVTLTNEKALTVPVAQQGGYTVLATAQVTALQLFDLIDHIALNKIYLVYIKAVVGTVYIKVNTAGTATFAEAAADLVLQVGESDILSINPAGNLGLSVDAAAATDAIEWHVLGKA
jgi:hypothetical protein